MSGTIKTVHFDSGAKGPHLLVFGAIHGDEVCGPLAIKHCTDLLRQGRLKLKAGSVTFVPVCNERAFRQNKRFTEQNLNRVFAKHAHPASYEEKRANALTALVDGCDYLLDLHSQASAAAPFVFQDYPDAKTRAFAEAAGVETLMTGWPQIFAGKPELNAGDTMGYAHEKGKTAIVVECGQHLDPRAPGVAYTAIVNSLIHLGLVEAPEAQAARPRQVVRATEIVTVPQTGGALSKKWRHLQAVKKGRKLAVSGAGKPIRAPYDAVVILPKYKAGPGQEWFYLGRRVK